jgi:hypothetical protein
MDNAHKPSINAKYNTPQTEVFKKHKKYCWAYYISPLLQGNYNL